MGRFRHLEEVIHLLLLQVWSRADEAAPCCALAVSGAWVMLSVQVSHLLALTGRSQEIPAFVLAAQSLRKCPTHS